MMLAVFVPPSVLKFLLAHSSNMNSSITAKSRTDALNCWSLGDLTNQCTLVLLPKEHTQDMILQPATTGRSHHSLGTNLACRHPGLQKLATSPVTSPNSVAGILESNVLIIQYWVWWVWAAEPLLLGSSVTFHKKYDFRKYKSGTRV